LRRKIFKNRNDSDKSKFGVRKILWHNYHKLT
jgi:hypothetical protein